jgi:hypothetical protein
MRATTVALLATISCAHAEVPARRVVERDVGNWVYRRFQKVEDIEVVVPGNAGTGFTAIYQTRETVGRPTVPGKAIAVAFVTEYERPAQVAETLTEKVGKLEDYRNRRDRIKGNDVIVVESAGGEIWVFWPSGRYLVKVGGRDLGQVPADLVTSYLALYPSSLPGKS